VLWQWRGKRLPGRAMAMLHRLREILADGGELAAELSRWLAPDELDATRSRVQTLIEHKVHPYPPTDWPAVPWPPV
jgi:hypothetical protein